VNFARTGTTTGTAAGAARVLIDGVEMASYTVTNMTTAQAVPLTAGDHILRVAFSTAAAGMTMTSISLAAPGATTINFSTDVDTLAAGFAANINVSGATTATRAELRRGADVIAAADIAAGAARLSVSKNDAAAGSYFLMLYNGDAFVGSREISIVPVSNNVWKISVETESNMIKAYFNTAIALDAARFDVKLAGVSVGGTLEADGRSINFTSVNASDYVGGEEVVITGVRLPGLFPDYVFTFRGVLTKK
jgi:hypothetical protein